MNPIEVSIIESIISSNENNNYYLVNQLCGSLSSSEDPPLVCGVGGGVHHFHVYSINVRNDSFNVRIKSYVEHERNNQSQHVLSPWPSNSTAGPINSLIKRVNSITELFK